MTFRTGKLCIVMVGLPARGKSTIAARLKENLHTENIQTRIFNNGDLRRKLVPRNTSQASFYDPNNSQATAIRSRLSKINIYKAKNFLRDKGQVAILDATNVSGKRRKLIANILSDQPVLFIECLSSDEEILQASIFKKASLYEFRHLSLEQATVSFKERIAYYEYIYEPFYWERNYLRLDSLNNQIMESKLTDRIPYFDQIRDLLVMDSVKNLFLVRHAESYDNVANRIGGNAHLTERGKKQAEQIGQHFKQTNLPYIFSSHKIRTIETAEPVSKYQKGHCLVVPLRELNEIDAGICEEMSYEEIREKKPDVFKARLKDKYNYIYPQGEGYVTMHNRIDKGIKKAIFLSGNSDNIMIVGHRAVNRMILAHFLYRRLDDVPYIYIPQDKYYHIISTQQKRLFELKKIG